jgi:hypothetical protein
MTGAQKILAAFIAKGYPQWAIKIEHEPVQYYGSGREGGWEVEIDDEQLEIPLDWGKEIPLPVLGTNDVYEVGYGYISAYSLKVVLQVIAQLDPFPHTTRQMIKDHEKAIAEKTA